MRLILLILLLCSFGADAQMIIKAHANYRPYAQPAANLLLDDYPNAAAAYSLRKLDKDYTGSAIRVRRSNDNAESDIGFTSSGDLDTASLKTFVGSNSGFVVSWYDQSGNNRTATQSTAASQPRIVNAGVVERQGSRPIIFYDGTNDFFTIGTQIFNNSAQSVFATARLSSEFGSIISAKALSNFDNAYALSNESNGRAGLFGGGPANASVPTYIIYSTNSLTNSLNLISGIYKTTEYELFVNGSSNATSLLAASNNVGSTCVIGRYRETDGNYNLMRLPELIIYPSNQSSNRTGIENNINDYYNIYWNGDFTGILDTYPNSAAAYSLRNLSSTYKGPLIRVRRSNDNAEQDIFGDYYGNLDTIGLKNFVGSNNAFVTTWYDQSGNNRNAAQSTAARQPRIANLGVIDAQNGEPCVFYDGNDNLFTSSDITHTSYTLFANIYLRNAATAANSQGRLYRSEGTSNVFDIGGNVTASFTNERLVLYNAESGIRGYAYVDADISIGTHLFTIDYTYLNTVDIRRNATSLTLQNIPFTASFYPKSFRNLGGGTSTTNGTFAGNIFEFILYTTSQTSNISGIQTNINNYYGIY